MNELIKKLEDAEIVVIDYQIYPCNVNYKIATDFDVFDSFYAGDECIIDESNIDQVKHISGGTYSVDSVAGKFFTLYKPVI